MIKVGDIVKQRSNSELGILENIDDNGYGGYTLYRIRWCSRDYGTYQYIISFKSFMRTFKIISEEEAMLEML